MTVNELIELLKEQEGDKEVLVRCPYRGTFKRLFPLIVREGVNKQTLGKVVIE